MNYFNHRVAMNHQLYQDAKDAATQRRMARRRIARRRRTAAIRQHNKLIALNMTLACVLGVAVGVLVCFIF